MICEIVGTFILVLVILFMGDKENSSEVGLGSVGALPVALLVVVIGSVARWHDGLRHQSGT